MNLIAKNCLVLVFMSSFTLAHAQTSVTTWAGSQTADLVDGSLLDARFNGPWSIARSINGNFYVADAGNNVIRKITPSGIVSTLAGDGNPGWRDGDSTAAEFNGSTGVCVDDYENVYVADFNNQRIRRISSKGVVTTVAGTGDTGYVDGPGLQSKFNYPRGITVDHKGNLYVGDSWNHRIRKIAPDGTVSTFAGGGTARGVQVAGALVDGPDSTARFYTPCGVVADASDNIFVADAYNHRIRKITAAGLVSTIAGSGPTGPGNGGWVDGDSNVSRLNTPTEVCLTGTRVYFSDTFGDRIRSVSNGVVSTLAGSGTHGYLNGESRSAQFSYPRGLVSDGGYLTYVCDYNNNCIRSINTSLGVKEQIIPRIAEVFPNPVSEKCTIDLSGIGLLGTVRLFDALGIERARLFAAPGTQSLELSLAGQPSGIYYICVPGQKSVAVEKR